jgi:hypothetical protein
MHHYNVALGENRMINPYQDINWQSVARITSASHMHIPNQNALENGYKHRIRHFPISNYYPSAPYDANTRLSEFRLRQHWPAQLTDGTIIDPPVNWNDIITWPDQLDEPYRSELPFNETDLVFSTIPQGVILSPNAEHHSFTNSPRCHICCPGSTFISGNFDNKNKYHLNSNGFCIGFTGTWQEAFKSILEHLKYPDAGGITINHPTWFSRFTDDQVIEMLNFDPRVLGIEIYNDYSARRDWIARPNNFGMPDESQPGFSLKMWDRILSTGRKCWGFSVPDHSVEKGTDWNGRNILLVSEFTEHQCLKAYRQGSFYGCLKDNGLKITDFTANDSSISVSVNYPATIKFITNAGLAKTSKANHATYTLPHINGTPKPVFVRVEIADTSGELLFLQPVIYKPKFRS